MADEFASVPTDLHTPTPAEELAQLLDDPLPADWDDPWAVEARQDHLAARAGRAATACVEALLHFRDLAARGAPARPGDAPVAALADALAHLDRSRRSYTHDTRRADALEVIEDAATGECGATVATIVTGLLERLRAGLECEFTASFVASEGSMRPTQ